MNKKDLEQFKMVLMEMRKASLGQIDHIKENDMNATAKEASGDHSAYSYHMADQGTDNMEREKTFFYAQRDGHTLQDILEALERVEDGSFGKCLECDEMIHQERLEAVPYAVLCIACQAKEEKISRINPFVVGE
ncbi:TraR/DksA family transcriptional regulator [bacterium]